MRRADGEYRWAIGAAAPRFAADREFLGYVGSVIDITGRKESETRREQALDAERAARVELERVNRTKDEFLATLSHELLASCEAGVTLVDSGSEALATPAAGPFDLLISDIGMPEVDGYDLIRRIRALAPSHGGNVPAIALTAYARPDDRERALRAGFQKHLAKPISRAALVTMCAGLLGVKP